MDGRNILIKPAEELYLYERLILLKRPKETTCRYAIQRLREQYGADFLAEIFENRPSGSGDNIFQQALLGYMAKNGITAYKKWGYCFDFLNGSYRWHREELRVSPKEEVFLYERTVLRLRGKRSVHRYATGNVLSVMRKKFGQRFLREVDANEKTEEGLASASTDGTKPDIIIEGDIQ
jgi:hypothetical protein